MLELTVYLIRITKNKSIRFKTPMLRLNLCDYSDGVYIKLKVQLRLRLLEVIMVQRI